MSIKGEALDYWAWHVGHGVPIYDEDVWEAADELAEAIGYADNDGRLSIKWEFDDTVEALSALLPLDVEAVTVALAKSIGRKALGL